MVCGQYSSLMELNMDMTVAWVEGMHLGFGKEIP
jgi:hypothetical protein